MATLKMLPLVQLGDGNSGLLEPACYLMAVFGSVWGVLPFAPTAASQLMQGTHLPQDDR